MANILYISNSSNQGGMELHILHLIKGMKTFGHTVYVWCPSGHMTKDYTNAGALVLERSIKYDFDIKYILSLRSFIQKNKIDIVHAHELKAGVNALLASYLSSVKKIITHTHTPISTWKVSVFKRNINVLIYSLVVNLFSTKEIALTETIYNIKRAEGIFSSKLKIIPNGIDIKEFNLNKDARYLYKAEIFKRYNIPTNSFVIGNLSRLTEEKGHNLLINSFDKLSIPNKYLLIAGGGKLLTYYQDLIQKLNIKNIAVITDRFEDSDKVKFYAAMDLFVFPSLTEGFGYVPLEAMLSQIPVIASDLPVLKDVCGNNVLYFKTGSENELTNAIESAYAKQDFLRSKTEEKRFFVINNYSLNKFWETYNNLYTN